MRRKARWRMAGLVVMLAMLCACTTPAEPTEPPTAIEPLVVQQEPIPQPEISLEETDELNLYITNGYLRSAAKEFQELHPEIKVRVDLVSTDELLGYLSGKVNLNYTPDILSMEPCYFNMERGEGYYHDVQKAIDDGWLLDLQRLMDLDETFDQENYIEGAMKSGQYRGGQYLLPFSVLQYYYLVSDQNQLDAIGYQAENVTDSISLLEELTRVKPAAVECGNYQGMITGLDSCRSTIDQFFRYTGVKLIDTETGTILPDPNQFHRLCRAIKAFYYDGQENLCSWMPGAGDQVYRQLSKGSSYFSNCIFTGAGFFNRLKSGGMEPVITATKNADGQKLCYVFMDVMGVSAKSRNLKNTWEFIRYVIDEYEGLEEGLPINKENYEYGLDHMLDLAVEYGSWVSDGQANELQPLTEEEREKIKEVYRGAETGEIYSRVQSLMFEECMEPYFKGEADFDSCAEQLQQQLKEYMLE